MRFKSELSRKSAQNHVLGAMHQPVHNPQGRLLELAVDVSLCQCALGIADKDTTEERMRPGRDLNVRGCILLSSVSLFASICG